MQEKTNPFLQHPIGVIPEPGSAVQVTPGVHWARLPIPFELNHINVWLLEDGDGFTLVDTGISSGRTRAAWEQLFAEQLRDKPINRIIVTHFHPDHFGLANWLCERSGADYYASEETHERVHFLLDVTDKDNIGTRTRFYQRHGISNAEFFEDFLKGSLYAEVVSGSLKNNNIIREGESIKIGRNEWQVIMSYGHAPGHINLFCETLKLLISGDQILPTITSNVSVYADQPDANPLDEYLESFKKFDFLPEDTLVLPSHGQVFEGVHLRIGEIIGHHRQTLEKVQGICEQPHSATELLPKLFQRELEGINTVLAFGETLSHLNYLCQQKRLRRMMKTGRYVYQQ